MIITPISYLRVTLLKMVTMFLGIRIDKYTAPKNVIADPFSTRHREAACPKMSLRTLILLVIAKGRRPCGNLSVSGVMP